MAPRRSVSPDPLRGAAPPPGRASAGAPVRGTAGAAKAAPRSGAALGSRILASIPSAETLRSWETRLENASGLRGFVQRNTQTFLTGVLGAGNSKVFVGDERLALLPARPRFRHGARDHRPRRAPAPEEEDGRQEPRGGPEPGPGAGAPAASLRPRGTRHRARPLPGPRQGLDGAGAPRPSIRRVAVRACVPRTAAWRASSPDLRRQGIEVFALDPASVPEPGQRYLRADTHWTPPLMERAAADLATLIRTKVSLPAAASPSPWKVERERPVERRRPPRDAPPARGPEGLRAPGRRHAPGHDRGGRTPLERVDRIRGRPPRGQLHEHLLGQLSRLGRERRFRRAPLPRTGPSHRRRGDQRRRRGRGPGRDRGPRRPRTARAGPGRRLRVRRPGPDDRELEGHSDSAGPGEESARRRKRPARCRDAGRAGAARRARGSGRPAGRGTPHRGPDRLRPPDRGPGRADRPPGARAADLPRAGPLQRPVRRLPLDRPARGARRGVGPLVRPLRDRRSSSR